MEVGAGLEALIGATSDGVVCLDENREVVLFNQTALRLIGVGANDLMGRPFDDLVAPDDRPSLRTLLDELARLNVASLNFQNPFPFRIVRPDGETKRLEATVTQTIMEAGRVFTFFVQDATERVEAELRVKSLQVELEGQIESLRARSERLTLLNALSDFLQSCLTVEEAGHELERFGRRLFSDGGSLLLLEARRNRLLVAASWGAGASDQDGRAEDCWAIRRGRTHLSRVGEPDRCGHLGSDARARVCVPLTASGEVIGALSVVRALDAPAPNSEEEEFLLAVADAVKLRISQIRRQSALRDQSRPDPVTGLLQLPALVECLRLEIERATRAQEPLGLIVVRLSGLDEIVAESGHDAARAVERALATTLHGLAMRHDVLGRIDEGCVGIVVAEGTRDRVLRRAHETVEAIDQLPLPYGIQNRPGVALGISLLYDHGWTAADLLEAALQAAKVAVERPIGRVQLAERP